MRDFDNLSAYLPNCVVGHVLAKEMLVPPQTMSYKTVALFADVSGFTVLSEALCNMGPDGVEELASQLNKFMAQIVKLTSRAGGDVLKFAGDALVAFWPEVDNQLDALQRAAQCAWDMQLRLANYSFSFHETTPDGKETDKIRYQGKLSVKLGIGVGTVSLVLVGGESDGIMAERYEYVAVGAALEEAFNSESFAKPGQVIVSKAAMELLKKAGGFVMEAVPESKGTSKSYHLKDFRPELTVRWKNIIKGQNVPAPTLEGEARVWKYVPAAVLPYLHESNEFWAPELRRVTTLFCNLGFTEADVVEARADDIQIVFFAVQQCVFQFEGTINKFLVDDKGSTLIAVFGLPPFAHENDSTRGVLAAMSVLSALEENGRKGSVGITTGVAFCGVVGTRGNRREYSVIGDPINTAARLMVEAKKRGFSHVMDEATSRDVRDDLSTEKVGMALLKGKAHETPMYQVSSSGEGAPLLQITRVRGGRRKHSLLSPDPSSAPTGAAPGTPDISKKKKKTDVAVGKKGTLPLGQASSASIGGGGGGTEMFRTQQEQVSAITEAPKLRAIRDEAIRACRNGGDATRANALVKGMESFAQQTQRGLAMGNGRAESVEDAANKPPAALFIKEKLIVKAAQIRFDNCATSLHEDGSGVSALTTTFTLPLVEGMETFGDLKEAALTRLGGRMLLRRGPNADRDLFSFAWGDEVHGGKPIFDDTSLMTLQNEKIAPVVKLVLLEHQERPRQVSSDLNRQSIRRNDAIRSQLEDVRNSLLRGEAGRVVVFEGTHGVGKSRLAAAVFLQGAPLTNVLTGVAMGNPYELQRLAKPFSVWIVLLKQLLEESLSLRGKPPTPAGGGNETREQHKARLDLSREILKSAITAAVPSFNRWNELDDVLFELVPQAANNLTESDVVVSPDRKDTLSSIAAGAAGGHKNVQNRAALLANIVVGLSIKEGPVLVIIDDSHFMDVGSWHITVKLAQEISSRGSRVLCVLLHRALVLADSFSKSPVTTTTSTTPATTGTTSNGVSSTVANAPETVDVFAGVDRHNMRAIDNESTKAKREVARLYDALLQVSSILHVEKKPNPEQTREIILETLGADDAPELLVQSLVKKSGGNALYIRDAVELYKSEDLIQTKGRVVQLGKDFADRNKYYELPVPHTVEGICATLLDTMSTTQQIALKVAAIIGEAFTLSLIKAVFPIPALEKELEAEWDALVRIGVVRETGIKGAPAVGDPSSGTAAAPVIEEMVYGFDNGWMLETIRKRMLLKQRMKLREIFNTVVKTREEVTRQKFMREKTNRFDVSLSGWLFVRKDHARNVLKPWKKRWVVLEGHQLVQFYDKENTRRLEIIDLDQPGTFVANRPGGFMGLETNFGEKHYPYCFTVTATKWTKKGIEMTERREFYMAPDTSEELETWVFRLGYAIDYFRVLADKRREQSREDSPTTRSMRYTRPTSPSQGSTGGGASELMVYRNPSAVVMGKSLVLGDDVPGSHMSSIAGVRQKPPGEDDGNKRMSAQPPSEGMSLMSLMTGGRKSFNGPPGGASSSVLGIRNRTRSRVPEGFPGITTPRAGASTGGASETPTGEFENPGTRVVPMTAAHFLAISTDEALAAFWATSETTMDDVLVVRANNSITWFYEFGDMAIVSLNGRGAIDGYLMGFISSRARDHAVVHQCAVIPTVRRHKIGTKLYSRFLEMAKDRRCRMVRVMVDRNLVEAIAFHRAMGFEEITSEEERLRELRSDMTVFMREVR